MFDSLQSIMQILDQHREAIVYQAADTLLARMPTLSLTVYGTQPTVVEHDHLVATLQRFHDIVQAGVLLDWELVNAEFAWGGRVLQRMGLTWDYPRLMMETYFATVLNLCDWNDDDRAALQELADHILHVAGMAYTGNVPADA